MRFFAEKSAKFRQKQPGFLEEQKADYHVPMRVFVASQASDWQKCLSVANGVSSLGCV